MPIRALVGLGCLALVASSAGVARGAELVALSRSAIAESTSPDATVADRTDPEAVRAAAAAHGLVPAWGRENDALPPPQAAIGLAAPASLAAGLVLPKPPGASSVVDLLILYTPGLRTRLGAGLEGRLADVVAIANRAYADSGVHLTIRLVGARQVDYPDTTSNSDALGHLTDESHPALVGVHDLRDLYGADLVSLVRPFDNARHGGCGIGWIGGFGGQPIAYGVGFAYSVVSDGASGGFYCDDVSFAHEISHNFGCMHDRATTASQGGGIGAYPFGFGFGVPGVFGTIMSYDFPRVALFSSPDLTCAGGPCGIDPSAPNSADNALALELTRVGVARFRPQAQLDFGFGSVGRALGPMGSALAAAHAVAVDRQGRIVTAGSTTRRGIATFTVMRWLPNGSLDGGFANGGVFDSALLGRSGRAEAVAVQSDGKIVVAGTLAGATANSGSSIALIRLDEGGNLDPTLGGDGIALHRIDGKSLSGHALALQADGKIVVAGSSAAAGSANAPNAPLLARFKRSGAPDRSFGKGGHVEQVLKSGDGSAMALAIAADGGLLVALDGDDGGGLDQSLVALRFTPTGALDDGFGTHGVAALALDGRAHARSLALARDGAILVAGDRLPAGSPTTEIALTRFTSAGKLDRTFGKAGLFARALGDGDVGAEAVAVASDGRILAAGSFVDSSTGDGDFVVLRLRPSGRLQSTFGSGGVAATGWTGLVAAAHALAIQGDGQVVVAGEAGTSGQSGIAVARYASSFSP